MVKKAQPSLTGLQLVLVGLYLSHHAASTAHVSFSDPGTVPAPQLTPDTLAGRTSSMKVLHAEARIFMYDDFLSAEECDQVIALATPRMSVMQIGPDRGRFSRAELPVITDIEQRIADLTLLPVHHGKGMQLLRYYLERPFHTHWDSFNRGPSNGGAHYATVLMYLSDVEEGGETFFPYIPAPGGGNDESFSECARDFLAVKPKKGRAVLFHGTRPSGAFEPRSLHDVCPVTKGTRWSLQKFLFVGRFAEKGETPQDTVTTINPEPLSSWADCRNQDPTCDTRWRDYSCYTNQTYMVGNVTHPGECLSTCMRCDIWQEHLKLKAQQQQREDQLQQQQPQEQQQQQRSRRAGAPGPHSAPQSGSTAQPSQAVLR